MDANAPPITKYSSHSIECTLSFEQSNLRTLAPSRIQLAKQRTESGYKNSSHHTSHLLVNTSPPKSTNTHTSECILSCQTGPYSTPKRSIATALSYIRSCPEPAVLSAPTSKHLSLSLSATIPSLPSHTSSINSLQPYPSTISLPRVLPSRPVDLLSLT
jgi:hypothetical protein